MGIDDEISMLFSALDKIGISVRIENCDSNGGLVRIRGEYILFIPKGCSVSKTKKLCLEALKSIDTRNIHLAPKIRCLLDEGETNGKD